MSYDTTYEMKLIRTARSLLSAELSTNWQEAKSSVRRRGRDSQCVLDKSLLFHSRIIHLGRRIDLPELANLVCPIVQDVFSLFTTGLFEVPLDYVLQLALPNSGLNSLHLYDLLIETFLKIIVGIVKVTDSTSHAGANIPANRTKDNNDTASHVLAAVVSGAFSNGVGSAVANTESFTRTTIGMEITTGGSI